MAAVTTPFFSSLPSTVFPSQRNLNSSHLIFGFSPLSVSISSRPNSLALRSAASPPAGSALEFAVTSGRNDADDFSSSGNLDISKLGISEEIVSALSRRGITQLFPIQRAVLEPAIEGRDLIGRAITGSGKTLAFCIPILDKIIQRRAQHRERTVPSALILAPTRELARQVEKEIKLTAPRLNSACLYGGIPIMNQVRVLGFGIDVAVGTPGRIIDLVERGALDLSKVRFVVLDEADQMLAVGFQEDVEHILSYLPAKRQSMLFSATMPSWVNELSREFLRDPLVIDLVGDSEQKLAEGISLYSVPSTASNKPNILPTLISKYAQGGKSIIFTQTKKNAEVLSRSIGGLLGSRALHGNMQQFQRDKTLAAFREGRFNVLVATDVAARGLDIPNVDLVIHFELPNTPEIFVHRSGRTGRAGKKGNAVLMFTESQRRAVRFIERDLGFKFEELPKITGHFGNTSGFMDAKENQYGQYGDSWEGLSSNFKRSGGPNYGNTGEMRGRHLSTFSRSRENFDEYEKSGSENRHRNPGRRYGYGNAGEMRDQHLSTFSRSRENFDDYENFRSEDRYKNPGRRRGHLSKPRFHLPNYDDFVNNYFARDASASQKSSFGRHSRSMDSKYQFGTGSFASERTYDDDYNSLAEGNSDGSEGTTDDFKKILDVLSDE